MITDHNFEPDEETDTMCSYMLSRYQMCEEPRERHHG